MWIQLHKEHKHKFLYQQIYEAIKQKILTQELQRHEQLPTKRQLAQQLNISLNSVMLAYEQLLVEGYIYTIERSGYFVEPLQLLHEPTQPKKAFPSHLKEIPAVPPTFSFSHMSAKSSHFPFKSWIKHQQEVIEQYGTALGELPSLQGSYEFRAALAKLIYTTRGVICEPEQIIVQATSQLLIEQLMMMYPQRIVALENPGYLRYYELLKRHKLRTILLPLDEAGVIIQDLAEQSCQFLITTPSHQFPTGHIMPISRRLELLHWASEQPDRYIIEDDYDSDFKYKTDNIPALQSLDKHDKVIYMGTFSKTLLPSIRISYMVLPPTLLAQYQQTYRSMIQTTNGLTLFTLLHFIQSGAYEKHVRKMNSYYEQLRTTLINTLLQQFGHNIQLYNVPAGLHFLVQVNTLKSYAEIEQAAREENVELYTIRRFLIQPVEPYQSGKYILIGFANLELETIDDAVHALQMVLF